MASNAPDTPTVLLGFDAREMIPPSAWNGGRRELFLLRPDVERPLSVDTAVWPNFRRDWSGKLNEHHLFESPTTARAFRDASNLRVPEHAPFFVFALLRIDDEAD